MGAYTTITIPRDLLAKLENVKRELKLKSYGEVISKLLDIYRREKARRFAEYVLDLRKNMREILPVVKETIQRLRGSKWAQF